MQPPGATPASARYTTVSDRFRALWTFFQFLGGVVKHLGDGPLKYSYDFRGLHRRLQAHVHAVGLEPGARTTAGLDQVERELDRIHRELARIEGGYPPSVLRRYFDHIKKQDERALCGLLKFYLGFKHFDQDTLDKLDILYTRLAEAPGYNEPAAPRDTAEVLQSFRGLADFAGLQETPATELAPLVAAVRGIRGEFEAIADYQALVESKVYDRYRRLKQRLGTKVLQPALAVEVTRTNIVARNRFAALLAVGQRSIDGSDDRIRTIETYLELHPELEADGFGSRLENLRSVRDRFESGRRSSNLKRDDLFELTRAMRAVLSEFDLAARPADLTRPSAAAAPAGAAKALPTAVADDGPFAVLDDPLRGPAPGAAAEEASLSELLPPDPLLGESLHRIMFALEMVAWDRPAAQIAEAPQVRNLGLESWEIEAYRRLSDRALESGTAERELRSFFLLSAALRIKMEEERAEIARLEEAGTSDRLYQVLEGSARSLERARDLDRRFQWFIEDMLFRGETHELEQVTRSRFRFLHTYSGLWLDHQRSGGLTPL